MSEFRELMKQNASMMKTLENLSKGRHGEGLARSMSKLIGDLNPSHFDGLGGPGKLEDWLREMLKLSVTVGCPEELWVDQGLSSLVKQLT